MWPKSKIKPCQGSFKQFSLGCVLCFLLDLERYLIVGTKFFLGLIFFHFVPSKLFFRPVAAAWEVTVGRSFRGLPYYVRLTMGWLCLLGIIFGSAFGFPVAQVCFASSHVRFSLVTYFGILIRVQIPILGTGPFQSLASLCSNFASGPHLSTAIT